MSGLSCFPNLGIHNFASDQNLPGVGFSVYLHL